MTDCPNTREFVQALEEEVGRCSCGRPAAAHEPERPLPVPSRKGLPEKITPIGSLTWEAYRRAADPELPEWDALEVDTRRRWLARVAGGLRFVDPDADPREYGAQLSGSGDGTMDTRESRGEIKPGSPLPAWMQLMALTSNPAALRAILLLREESEDGAASVNSIAYETHHSQTNAAIVMKSAEQAGLVRNVAPRTDQKRYVLTEQVEAIVRAYAEQAVERAGEIGQAFRAQLDA